MNQITPEMMQERLQEVVFNLFSQNFPSGTLMLKQINMRPNGEFHVFTYDVKNTLDRATHYTGYNQEQALIVYNSIK